MENRDGGHQLLLTIHITIGDVRRTAKALIDTGAQVSIVRQGLLPDECFRAARKPLLLKTASGELLPGGQHVASLLVEIDAETDAGCPVKTPWKTNITVHDGDVGADMIIGYPWLRRQRLDIQPWRNALQLHDHPFWVLRPQRDGRTSGVETRAITMDIMAVTKEDEKLEESDDGAQVNGAWIFEVEKMQLTLVTEIDVETGEETVEAIKDEATIMEAAAILKELNETPEVKFVCGVVVAENEFPGDFAANLREEIQHQFEGRVFRDRIFPDPPERGQHGKAKLHLKPDAIPVVSRTIHLAGERLQALKELEAEWRRDWKIEPGRGPWRAAAFPIKKKSGKWRGVCDYAITNKMIHQDSYPLPLTENITAEMAACEVFSTVDLRDAFHQVALDEESR